ncbi:MvdC/MvdD family ATP grasp protein [Virgibacillus sp. DJP39]|uniref:MvdC/MvdD family ATP grasp protein n=1 Tax=Virgibacillus sp. DJP39 TaxID=3409790 RepID=UPI003BB6CF14
MYILIITNSMDLTVDSIIHRFSDKVCFFRFNTDKFNDYEIKVTNDDTVVLNTITNVSININDCHGVYYRKITLPDLQGFDAKYRNLMYKEMMTIIEGIAENAGKVVLTRPSILKKADNKIVQLHVAKEVGFTVPPSLLTNSNRSAREFVATQESSIVKPISVGRINTSQTVNFIQTNKVKDTGNVEGLEFSPAYFQTYVEKDYEVRLTIVHGKCFGVKVESSNNVDWRKKDAKVHYSKIKVPEDIEKKCYEMMDKLDIHFAAFDFIVNNQKYVFLELNANGQWQWLEEKLNLGISDKIVKYLTGEDKNEK